MLDEPNNLNNDNIDNPVDNEPVEEIAPPEETSNRTFLIVAGVLGFLILLTLAGIAAYIFYFGPKLAAPRQAAQQTRAAENALAIAQETATAEAALWTPTAEPSLTPTNTPVPTLAATNTPVVNVVGAGATATTNLSEQSTLIYLQTQLAVQLTGTAAAGTPALASTGFFDDVGLPGLIVLTLALLGVIFLARRLRAVPVRQ